jgi:hypothetical protein
MAKDDKNPPLLTGFSNRRNGKGKALSSPTTSMWLAIIFVAIFFALMSVQQNISKAEDALRPKDDGKKRSGYIVPAPEKHELGPPPLDPASLLPKEEEIALVIEETIELETTAKEIEIKPIEIQMDVSLPEDSLSINPEID